MESRNRWTVLFAEMLALKTEVALRAAFKAVIDGKQVAMLAPTTILLTTPESFSRPDVGFSSGHRNDESF